MAFNLKEFFRESVETVLSPKKYFGKMAVSGGYGEPVIKAALYGIASGIVSFVFQILRLNTSMIPMPGIAQTGGFGAAFAILIFTPIAAIIGVFIGGIVILVLAAICGGSTKIEADVRVTAALMALAPVSTLLSGLYAVNVYAGLVVSLAVSVYGLVMMYFALTESLKTKPGSTRVLAIVLGVLLVVFSVGGYFGMRQGTRYLQNLKNELEKDGGKTQEELLKKIQELTNKIMDAANKDK